MKNTGPNMAQPNDQQAHTVASDAKDHPLVLHALWAVVITCSLAGMLRIGMGAHQRQMPHNAPVLLQKERHLPQENLENTPIGGLHDHMRTETFDRSFPNASS